MDYDIDAFESIGANCEFGFFLRKKGNHAATLLRWVEVLRVEKLISLISGDFRDILLLQNIRPFNTSMVLDSRHSMAWHTPLHSVAIDETKPARGQNLRFAASEEEMGRIWQEQTSKVNYFVERMRERLRSSQVIYVFKPRIDDLLNEDRIFALHDALNLYGRNRLLIVTLADEANPSGIVREVRPDLVLGQVDRFAPGGNAADVSEGA